MSEFTIKWEVHDGYAGGSRPQTSSIPASEFDHCETQQEVEEAIDQFMEEEMRDRVECVVRNRDELLEWASAAQDAEE